MIFTKHFKFLAICVLCLHMYTQAASVSVETNSDGKLQCDKIECPPETYRCTISESSKEDPSILKRINICYSRDNQILAQFVSETPVDSKSKINNNSNNINSNTSGNSSSIEPIDGIGDVRIEKSDDKRQCERCPPETYRCTLSERINYCYSRDNQILAQFVSETPVDSKSKINNNSNNINSNNSGNSSSIEPIDEIEDVLIEKSDDKRQCERCPPETYRCTLSERINYCYSRDNQILAQFVSETPVDSKSKINNNSNNINSNNSGNSSSIEPIDEIEDVLIKKSDDKRQCERCPPETYKCTVSESSKEDPSILKRINYCYSKDNQILAQFVSETPVDSKSKINNNSNNINSNNSGNSSSIEPIDEIEDVLIEKSDDKRQCERCPPETYKCTVSESNKEDASILKRINYCYSRDNQILAKHVSETPVDPKYKIDNTFTKNNGSSIEHIHENTINRELQQFQANLDSQVADINKGLYNQINNVQNQVHNLQENVSQMLNNFFG